MKVNNWVKNNLLARFSSLRSPCVLCGSYSNRDNNGENTLCLPCRGDIQSNAVGCSRCALPLIVSEQLECGRCQKRTPYYRSVYRLALYQEPLNRLILQFKFQHKLHIGKTLGTLMAEDIDRQMLPLPDLLLPVPLHAKRLRQRGYNQAVELARPIAKRFSLPVETKVCHRIRVTPEQMGLSAKSRKENLKGAFEVRGNIEGKQIAIIDDVMTTGSTANELSQQLLKAGAKYVDVWVCARAAI